MVPQLLSSQPLQICSLLLYQSLIIPISKTKSRIRTNSQKGGLPENIYMWIFCPLHLFPDLEWNDNRVYYKFSLFHMTRVSHGRRFRRHVSQSNKCFLKPLLLYRHWGSGKGQGNPRRLIGPAVPGLPEADHSLSHCHVFGPTTTCLYELSDSSEHSRGSALIQWLCSQKTQCLSLSSTI